MLNEGLLILQVTVTACENFVDLTTVFSIS